MPRVTKSHWDISSLSVMDTSKCKHGETKGCYVCNSPNGLVMLPNHIRPHTHTYILPFHPVCEDLDYKQVAHLPQLLVFAFISPFGYR